MTQAAALAWIRSRLEAAWAARTEPLTWANESADEDAAGWARAAVREGAAEIAELPPTYRHYGQLVVETFTPLAAGVGLALEMAAVPVAAFRAAGTTGLSFRAPYTVTIGEQDGTWFKLDVLCPFTRDDT